VNYDTLKAVSQVGTYVGLSASSLLAWINFQYRTSREPESGHRKMLTPVGKLYGSLLIASFGITLVSAIAQNVADSHLKKDAERRGNQQVQNALEQQHNRYVSDLKLQFQGQNGVIPKISEQTQELKSAESHIISQSNEAIDQLTGGDSYMFLQPSNNVTGPLQMDFPNFGSKQNALQSFALPKFNGRHPLHDVQVMPAPYLQFRPEKTRQHFFIFISTSNGTYSQIIFFLKTDNKWAWSSRLSKYTGTNPTLLRKWSDPTFPASGESEFQKDD
jgi:hypothetical protein